jgi:type II secretory pathway component PulF
MKYFDVTVLARGKKTKELFKAHSKIEAKQKALRKYPKSVVLKVIEGDTPLEDKVMLFMNALKEQMTKKNVNLHAQVAAMRQLAVMTNAGLTIHDSVAEVALNTTDAGLKEILTKIADDIDAGHSMSDSIEPFRDRMGNITLAMVQLGEKTGNLAESLHKLSDILENIRDNIAKFKKAIRQPLITLGAMAIAFTILIMVVVPKFKQIFEELGADLPLATKILLGIEHVFNNYGLLTLSIIVATLFVIKYFYTHEKKFKYRLDSYFLKIYLIKDIIYYSSMNRFFLVFGELVKSGVPITEALETSTDLIDNLVIKEKLESVVVNVSRGSNMAHAFTETGLVENMLIQMIKAGETSGTVDAMIGKVADYYDMKFQALLDNMSSYIEPIMLAFIAALVLLLALGIFMPMWDMAQAAKV